MKYVVSCHILLLSKISLDDMEYESSHILAGVWVGTYTLESNLALSKLIVSQKLTLTCMVDFWQGYQYHFIRKGQSFSTNGTQKTGYPQAEEWSKPLYHMVVPTPTPYSLLLSGVLVTVNHSPEANDPPGIWSEGQQ